MKLSDVVGAAGLSIYAEVGLLIFLGVFLAICITALSKHNAERWEMARTLPLSDSHANGKPQKSGHQN